MLLQDIFPERLQRSVQVLSNDPDCRRLVYQQIGSALMECPEIVSDMPLQQIEAMVSHASFAESDEECTKVSCIVYKTIMIPDILPLMSQHSGMELASRCLVSLAVFAEAMRSRQDRYGYPSPDFYRTVGRQAFQIASMDDIAEHFTKWEGFLGEMFCV